MKCKTKDLKIEADQIKKWIEKYKKIPKASTLESGQILSPYMISYLFSKLILDPKKSEVNSAEVILYNGSKLTDTIKDEKILKDDYLDMIKRFVKYCDIHKRVPAYVTTKRSSTKVSFELFYYCLAKIVVYYKQNNTLPNYCVINKGFVSNTNSNSKTDKKSQVSSICSNPYKSKPHPTKSGCGGMGQDTNYYCGVSALQKVLFKFGITKFSQKQLAAWAGTTTKGTDHTGLETALAKVSRETGIKLTCKWYNFSDLGWEKLAKMICKPNVDALTHCYYRLQYGHYEVINEIDLKNKQVKILNSLGSKCGSSCYCGYVEQRSFAIQRQYFAGISQKSIMIITKG